MLIIFKLIGSDPVRRGRAALVLGEFVNVFLENDGMLADEKIGEVVQQGRVVRQRLEPICQKHVPQVLSEGFVECVLLIIVDGNTA